MLGFGLGGAVGHYKELGAKMQKNNYLNNKEQFELLHFAFDGNLHGHYNWFLNLV